MTRKRRQGGTTRDAHLVAMVPDIHVPFHDETACAAARDFLTSVHPDSLVLLGDMFDFYSVSAFSKDPDRVTSLQEELDVGQKVLSDLCYGMTTDRHYTMGNHCHRLQTYLKNKAPALSKLRSLEFDRLTGLKDAGFETYPYGNLIQFGNLHATHGSWVSQFSGVTARFHMERLGVPVVHGHTHRLGAYWRSTAAGTMSSYEAGHLALPQQEYTLTPTNWQQGLALAWIDEDEGDYWVDLVEIRDGKIFWGGTKYE